MKYSVRSPQIPLTQLDVSSTITLIEYGLQCALQGNWSEAGYTFQLAREQLTSAQQQFTSELDLCLQIYLDYVQAQQDLQRASKQFVQAESALHAQRLLLEKLLSTLKNRGDAEQREFEATARDCPDDLCPGPTCTAKDRSNLPKLDVITFGHFEVRRGGQTLPLCQSRNGQAILRFLVTQPGHRASADTLMDMLWSADPSTVARHKLQVAISALRCSLNSGLHCGAGGGYILCKDQIYQLNPAIAICADMDEFLRLWEAGQQSQGQRAIELYEQACNLRCGPFLGEDLYADWSFLLRDRLNQIYLIMCHVLSDYYFKIEHYAEAAKWSRSVLEENRCDEKAHQRLMHIYIAQGWRSEALRQYRLCEHLLNEEMGISPSTETVQLFQILLAGDNSLIHKDR